MKTGWFFGDSFLVGASLHWESETIPNWFWPTQVGNNISELYDGRFVAMPGVSNEWIMNSMKQYESDMKPNDYLIVVSTSKDRRWFIEDKPHVSNLHINSLGSMVTKKQHRALTYYLEEFYDQHNKLSELYEEQFLIWCRWFANKNNLKLCLLPGFAHTDLHTSVNGTLFEIDKDEFINDTLRIDLFLKLWNGRDRRIGHLHEDNHTVLAQKIVRYFKYNEPIDLYTGFRTKIFNTEEDIINYVPRDISI